MVHKPLLQQSLLWFLRLAWSLCGLHLSFSLNDCVALNLQARWSGHVVSAHHGPLVRASESLAFVSSLCCCAANVSRTPTVVLCCDLMSIDLSELLWAAVFHPVFFYNEANCSILENSYYSPCIRLFFKPGFKELAHAHIRHILIVVVVVMFRTFLLVTVIFNGEISRHWL